MSLMKASLESPPIAIPLKARLNQYLVESICELARLVRDKGVSNNDVSGLLFGKVEPGVRVAEALKIFVDMGPHSELARRQRWEKAYRATADEAKKDPELAQLEIVGWFSFRAGSGLLNSDVVFHNQHFRKPDDLAVIIWREGPSQITVEVYSKSESEALTCDDYRWGSLRLSADIRHMREPVELALRVKLNDDSYLRAYHNDEPVSHFEGLKRRAEAVSNRLLGFMGRSDKDVELEDVKGLISDGREGGRMRPSLDGHETFTNTQAYFNPYSDHIVGRGRMNRREAKPSGDLPTDASQALPPAPINWPGSGSGFGTAPARSPDFRSDGRIAEPEMPANLAPEPLIDEAALELLKIGRAPISGRSAANEIGGLPMLLRPPTPPSRPSVWPWAIGICLVCSAVVFGFLALGGLQGENGLFAQIMQTAFPGNSLNLHVRNEDDRLRLTWNQRNHTVASASDATLQIFDGPLSREIHLDGRQVADGSVLYRPQTNDVTFRLEVRGEQGSTTGSVRVLDGLSSRQSTLDVSAPLQNSASRLPAYPSASGDGTLPALLPEGTSSGANLPAANPAGVPNSSATVPASSDPAGLLTNTAPASNTAPAGSTPAATRTSPSEVAPLPLDVLPLTPAPVRSHKPHYETPETIKPIRSAGGASPDLVATPAESSAGGTTINGWDAVPTGRSSRTKTGPGFVAPKPILEITPDVRNLPVGTIPARVRVAIQVGIDANGRVMSARPLTSGINSGVLSSALAAARQWTFTPAESNGHRVASRHTVVFEFPAR